MDKIDRTADLHLLRLSGRRMKNSWLLVLPSVLLSVLMLSATCTLALEPTLTVNANTVAPGDPVIVTIKDAPGGQYNWMALAPVGSSLPTAPEWTWVGAGVTNRTWTAIMPYQKGSYEIRLFRDQQYTQIAVSPEITQPTTVGPNGDLVRFPSKVLEILAGPLTSMGTEAYDTIQWSQAKKWIDATVAGMGDNFYDFSLALYAIAYRTDKPYWFEKARAIGLDWSKHLLPTPPPPPNPYIACCGPDISPWDHAPLGIAILAVEQNDTHAKAAVMREANIAAGPPPHVYPSYGDQRQAAYSLISFTAAELLGGTAQNAKNNRLMLEAILAQQNGGKLDPALTPGMPTGPNPYRQTHTDGCWYNPPAPGAPFNITVEFTENFMNGLLLEALALYDRAIGDPRIVPAMQRCADWMWTNQWDPVVQGFQYASVVQGTLGPGARPVLNGLILPAWGYLYLKTGDQKYKTQGDQILQGLINSGAAAIGEQKQYVQLFRSSYRYFGYLAQAGGQQPRPQQPQTGAPPAASTPPTQSTIPSSPNAIRKQKFNSP